MAADPHRRVLAFLEEFHATRTPDFNRLGSYFAEHGYYQPLVPSIGRIVGPASIAAALEKQYQTYYECRCEIHASAAAGRFVFTERTDHVVLHHGDRRVGSRVCAVFEVDAAGLFEAWREYWDTGDVAQQMGIRPSDVIDAASA